MVNVKNFYLNNAMTKHEYYKIAIRLIPQDVIDEYNLMYKKINGFLYVRTEKGMCGPVQAGIIGTHGAQGISLTIRICACTNHSGIVAPQKE